jgi:hypothetical protein
MLLYISQSQLFIEKLDWGRVKKLGVKHLQLRLEDFARRIEEAAMRAPAAPSRHGGAYSKRQVTPLYDAITHQSPSPTAFLSFS